MSFQAHLTLLKSQLVRAITGSFALSVTATGLGFLTSVVLARALGAGGYGAYAYAFAWVNVLCIPAQLGFDKLLVREVAIYQGRKQWGYLRGLLRSANWACFITASLIAGSVFGITLWFRDAINAEFILPLWIALLLVPITVLTRVRQATMSGLRRVIQGQISENLVRPLCFLMFMLGASQWWIGEIAARDAVAINVFAAIIAFCVGAMILLRALAVHTGQAAPAYQFKNWIGSAFPMMLLASLQAINAHVDVLMLGAMKGEEVVGIYYVALRYAALISFILIAVNSSLGPRIAQLYDRQDLIGLQRLVTMSSRAILVIAVPILAILVMFGEWFLSLFGEEFVTGHTVLTILCLGQIVNSAMGSIGLILTMTGNEGLAARGAGITAVMNIALNAVLIPRYGMEGAAVSSALALISWNLIFAYWVYRRVGIVPSAFARLS